MGGRLAGMVDHRRMIIDLYETGIRTIAGARHTRGHRDAGILSRRERARALRMDRLGAGPAALSPDEAQQPGAGIALSAHTIAILAASFLILLTAPPRDCNTIQSA